MRTTTEQKIKISFEFENLKELDEIYGFLNCACLSVDMRISNATREDNIKYYKDVREKLNSFTEIFNPASINAKPISK